MSLFEKKHEKSRESKGVEQRPSNINIGKRQGAQEFFSECLNSDRLKITGAQKTVMAQILVAYLENVQ